MRQDRRRATRRSGQAGGGRAGRERGENRRIVPVRHAVDEARGPLRRHRQAHVHRGDRRQLEPVWRHGDEQVWRHRPPIVRFLDVNRAALMVGRGGMAGRVAREVPVQRTAAMVIRVVLVQVDVQQRRRRPAEGQERRQQRRRDATSHALILRDLAPAVKSGIIPLMRPLTLVVVLMTLAAPACRRSIPTAEWTATVQPVASPAAGISLAPQLTTSSLGVLVSWVEQADETSTLKFAERTASGWSPVRTVASGNDWFLSYADTPSVLRLSDGTLVANWLKTTEPRIEAYDLPISYSRDDGKTWAASFLPHHDNTKSQHGFASFVELPNRAVGVIWLDGRDIATSTDFAGGNMAVRFATFDSQFKQTGETQVDGKVCECCPTTAVVTADGVLTAFRDRSDAEIRDIHVSRLENGKWTPSTAVHDDKWEIYACPVNGPMLSARGRDVVAAWFTAKEDKGQAWAAFSSDAGRTWGAPIRLDDGESAGRVDVEMLEDGSAVASWIEFANQRSQFRIRRIDRAGAKSAAITVGAEEGARPSGYPRVARAGNELVFAWTEGTTVKTAVAALP